MMAGELMEMLNADPHFVAEQAAREAKRQKVAAALRQAEKPLVEELRVAGFAVDSIWDLVNTAAPYVEALPILFAHLQRPYPGPVREGIARALGVPEARIGWDLLTRLFREERDRGAKDGLAVAIAAAADDTVVDDVIDFARDLDHGPSRLLLLSALERSRDPRARATLSDLAKDPDLTKEIRVILRRLNRGGRRALIVGVHSSNDETPRSSSPSTTSW